MLLPIINVANFCFIDFYKTVVKNVNIDSETYLPDWESTKLKSILSLQSCNSESIFFYVSALPMFSIYQYFLVTFYKF